MNRCTWAFYRHYARADRLHEVSHLALRDMRLSEEHPDGPLVSQERAKRTEVDVEVLAFQAELLD
jgi:hypothetical protein